MKQIIFAFIAVCFVAVTGLFSYAYFVYIPDKVEKNIIRSFNNFGFEELKIEKLDRRSGQIILSNIALDKDKFSTIDQANIEFSLFNFLISPDFAQNITVKGLKLTGDLQQESRGINISGWNNTKEILDNLQKFPAGTIAFEDSQLDLLTEDFGGVGLKFDARINIKNSNNIKFKLNIKTKEKKLSAIAKIEGEIDAKGNIKLTSDIEDISVILPNMLVKRGLAKLKILYQPNHASSSLNIYGNIDIASIRLHDMPLKGVKGNIKINDNIYNIDVNGSIFGENPIKWKSSIEKKSNNIFSKTIIEPDKLEDVIEFFKQNNGLSLGIKIPYFILNQANPVITIRNNLINKPYKILGDVVITTDNPEITIKADYNNNNEKSGIKGVVKIDETTLKIDKNQKEDNNTYFDISAFGEFTIKNLLSSPHIEWFIKTDILDGKLDFDVLELSKVKGSVFIGKTAKVRNEKVKPLSFSLPLKKSIPYSGKIRVNIDSKTRPILDKLSLKIYGGKIITKYPIFNNNKLVKNNSLIVSDINISDLLHDAGFKNIFMQGKLGGVIPFEIKDNKIKVNGAILQSQNSGILMLPDKIIAGLFPGNSKKMINIRAALKNYHYEYFEIRFDGDLNNRVMMTLNARGSNPRMKSKDGVDLNLQIETQISLLFKNLTK